MKRLSIWMLVIALVLGIGFAVMAEGIAPEHRPPCPPPDSPGCPDVLPTKTMNVTLRIPKYARLNLNDLNLCLPEPGSTKESEVGFGVSANCNIKLTIQSNGFNSNIANNWVRYRVTWQPSGRSAADAGVEVEPLWGGGGGGYNWKDPGTVLLSNNVNQGVHQGTIKAKGEWKDGNNWTTYTAGTYSDVITFTVAAPSHN